MKSNIKSDICTLYIIPLYIYTYGDIPLSQTFVLGGIGQVIDNYYIVVYQKALIRSFLRLRFGMTNSINKH